MAYCTRMIDVAVNVAGNGRLKYGEDSKTMRVIVALTVTYLPGVVPLGQSEVQFPPWKAILVAVGQPQVTAGPGDAVILDPMLALVTAADILGRLVIPCSAA